jgi:hypothetical protein
MSFAHIVTRLLKRRHWPGTQQPESRDLFLGTKRMHNREEPVILPEAARCMHLGIMGLSGVGKTYLLENLIRQDIDQKTGFVLFDVHGDLADNIITYLAEHTLPTPELLDRVVVIEPFDPDYSIGFNPLERAAHTSPFVQAQELAHILRSRWETKSFGARTEELLRSSLYTLSASNLTLVELPRLLTNSALRSHLVRTLPEPAIRDYWKGRYERLSEPMKSAVREPLLTRISAFLADPQVREIVGQQKSTFAFRDAIANGLWVVINLSKGKLGDNSAVLGSLLFTKLELDVMAQAYTPVHARKLFAVYADELQNIAGRNFATLIAEARKYRISVTAGHQFWRQLSPEMQAAMLGVGSRVFFRLHYHDAQALSGELDAKERQWYTALLTRLSRGEAVFRSGAEDPMSFTVLQHRKPSSTPDQIGKLKERSLSRYATRRQEIRSNIWKRYETGGLADTMKRLNRPHEQPTP